MSVQNWQILYRMHTFLRNVYGLQFHEFVSPDYIISHVYRLSIPKSHKSNQLTNCFIEIWIRSVSFRPFSSHWPSNPISLNTAYYLAGFSVQMSYPIRVMSIFDRLQIKNKKNIKAAFLLFWSYIRKGSLANVKWFVSFTFKQSRDTDKEFLTIWWVINWEGRVANNWLSDDWK